jgi:hypothetical protein
MSLHNIPHPLPVTIGGFFLEIYTVRERFVMFNNDVEILLMS